MEDLSIRVYLLVRGLGARAAELRNEKGQTAAEYVGILAFVAAVVGVVLAANTEIGEAIVNGIRNAIESVSGG